MDDSRFDWEEVGGARVGSRRGDAVDAVDGCSDLGFQTYHACI